MKTQNPSGKLVVAVAIVSFAFAFYTQVIWAIIATNRQAAHEDHIQLFLNFFPRFLRSISSITYLTLVCSIIAVCFAVWWMKISDGIGKLLPILILIIAGLIVLLTLFQLM